MIHIGLAGWGDHDDLYAEGTRSKDKLSRYAAHFQVVECDSTFYAIPSQSVVERWIETVPEPFGYVVKAYQGMTGHRTYKTYYESAKEMYQAFVEMVAPIQAAGKLSAVLMQVPPWFDCTRTHVDILRRAREWLQDLPVALEFRHQSWFRDEMREKTLEFMREEQWIHSVCDEPQVSEGSIPIVLESTDDEMTIVRFHGRNASGWVKQEDKDWREVRYLYQYSVAELSEWVDHVIWLEQHSKQVVVIFNNNSGGHAARNAKQFMELLGQHTAPLAPRQISLFD
ncbi:MAG: DUF72 domain-containing protein [Paenibacillus sp.]|nr:DUF72 domain-containing protein [Paenibacillus sp.]